MSDLRHEWVIGVSISEQRGDGQKDLGDGESGRPLVFKDVQTDTTVRVDVGVVDSGCEVDLRRFERIISGEVDV